MLNRTETKQLRKIHAVLSAFREVDADMPVASALALVDISLNREPMRVKDLIKRIGVSQSAASRLISLWTDWTWRKKEGPGYVADGRDPMDTRSKQVQLTPQGEKFIERLTNIMEKN